MSVTTAGPLFSAAAEGTDDHGSSSGHLTGGETLVIFFLFAALFLGGIFKEINKKTGIPYTPMLFILGILCGAYYQNLGIFGASLHTISDVDPHGLLLIFLPILIFESGFNADWHIFKRQFVQIITLAVPCVFVSAIFIAFSLKVVLGYSDDYYTWLTAFMFGAILSCTDTVAVLALLKEAGASKKFNALIEGESLINDGTCMVLLTIAAEVVKGKSMSPAEVVSVFCQLTLGGTVLGIVFGVFSAIWIRKIFNDEILVVNITLIACYMVYFVAENVDLGIKISGIIALVSLGLFMAAFGKTRINSESEHAVHTFWKYAVYCAETVIFLVAGIIIGVKVLMNEKDPEAISITTDDLYKLVGLYGCMTVSRFFSIALFMPILKRHGYGLTWREVFVLTYGGLRGAIGISFALIVARDTMYAPTLRHFILFDMAGCAFLTLVINGTTTGYLVKKLGLAGASPIKHRVFLGYLQQFLEQVKEYQEELKVQPYLSAVDWTKVNDLVGIPKLEQLIVEEANRIEKMDKTYKKPAHLRRPSEQKEKESKVTAPKKSSKMYKDSGNGLGVELLQKDDGGKYSVASSSEEGSSVELDSDEQLVIEARNRFLMALKGEYYHLFALSQCGPDSFILLKESADWDLDREAYPMSSWDHISIHFMNPSYIRFLFFMKSLPIVGKYAKNALFNHLSYVYDVVLNYVNAHETVENIADTFPFEEEVLRVVLKESEENRTIAEGYINNYLNVSFPEINKSIQMKKAAYNILNREKDHLEETHHQGQLEDKEFKVLKKIIDVLSYSLGETTDSWDLPPLNEFMRKLIFFSSFTEEEMKEIMLDAKEKPFSKDEFITKEGQPADYLYVITRGVAYETCKQTTSHFKEKKSVGSVISYHQVISSTQRYHTSVVAETMVYALRLNLGTIRKIVRKHKEIEEYLWRESFFFMARLFSQDLVMFEHVDRSTISQILSLFRFKKYKPDSIIDFTKGGIFLKGVGLATVEKKASGLPRPGQSDEEGTVTQIRYHQITYFAPGNTKQNILKAEKTCWVFHFMNFERIVDLVNSGAAEREKSRSMSFASFRRGSHKQLIKLHKSDAVAEKDEPTPKDPKDLEAPYLDRSPSHVRHRPLEVIDETETT